MLQCTSLIAIVAELQLPPDLIDQNRPPPLESNSFRVVVSDEVHNLLPGTPREQRVTLQLLRYLSNEIKASDLAPLN